VAGGSAKIKHLHSRPTYYGALTAVWCGIPALVILGFWLAFESSIVTQPVIADLPAEMRNLPAGQLNLIVNDIRNLVSGNIVSGDISPATQDAADHYRSLQTTSNAALAVIAIAVAMLGLVAVPARIKPGLRARNIVEQVVRYILIACSTMAIFTTIGIVLSVLSEAILFFKAIPVTEFLFGLKWSPQTAIRSDQVGSSGAFGAVPVFWGTALISAIALAVAVPIGLMSAIYLSEYANKKFRTVAKPLIEILAGIPTVVYGFFAALTVAPFIRDTGSILGLSVSSESALAAFALGLLLFVVTLILNVIALHVVRKYREQYE
jgi:phosphate transport system permease protein